MKQFVLALVFVGLAAVASAASTAKDKPTTFTTKYDNIDIDEILHNERLLSNYFKCLMDKGKCTPDGAELKKNLPDALAKKCSQCSEKQKAGSERIIHFLIEEKPLMWAELESKYDPKGTYKTSYKEEAEKRGIKLPS